MAVLLLLAAGAFATLPSCTKPIASIDTAVVPKVVYVDQNDDEAYDCINEQGDTLRAILSALGGSTGSAGISSTGDLKATIDRDSNTTGSRFWVANHTTDTLFRVKDDSTAKFFGALTIAGRGTLTDSLIGVSARLSGNLTVAGTTLLTGAATLTAAPVLSALTASLPVFTNGSKALASNAMTGTGNVVMSASPTLTGTLAAANGTYSGTLGVTGVGTFTAAPVFSSATASLPLFTDGSKAVTSNAMTGTGSVMMSASPTTTGTLTGEAANFSGAVSTAGLSATTGQFSSTLGVSGDANFGSGSVNLTNGGASAITQNGGGYLVVSTTSNNIYLDPADDLFIRPAGSLGVRVLEVTSADRYITLAGSNGGNPTIGVSAGSLAFSPAVAMASTLGVTGTLTGAASTWSGTSTLSNGTLIMGATTNSVLGTSSDGTDNQRLILNAGGATGSTARGAFLAMNGNEFSSNGGDVILAAGNVSGGGLSLATGAQVDRLTIDDAGAAQFTGTLGVTGKLVGSDSVVGVLGFRAGGTDASNVSLYRSAADMWTTADSLTVGGNLIPAKIAMGVTGGNETSIGVGVWPSNLTGTTQIGVHSSPTTSSAATAGAYALYGRVITPDAAFTQTDRGGLLVQDGTVGASATVTNNYGISIGNITAGTNDWALKTGTGKVELGDSLVVNGSQRLTGGLALGGRFIDKTTALTGNTTLGTSHSTIFADATSASFTLTLPAVSGNTGLTYTIYKNDASSNTVTIDGNASETIDGNTTEVLGGNGANSVMTIVCTGTTWRIRELRDVGGFTVTASGMTASTTGTCSYNRIGRSVTLVVPYLSGTSNTTQMELTGLPSFLIPYATQQASVDGVVNNGSNYTGFVLVSYPGGELYPYYRTSLTAAPTNSYTGSGTKGIEGWNITYTK